MTEYYKPSLQTWFNPTPEQRAANRRFLFSFRGIADRQSYWCFSIAPGLIFFALAALFNLPTRMTGFGFTIATLLILWVSLAVAAKRCHDRGRSAWFLLVLLVPVVGPLWAMIELGFLPARQEGNAYLVGAPSTAKGV